MPKRKQVRAQTILPVEVVVGDGYPEGTSIWDFVGLLDLLMRLHVPGVTEVRLPGGSDESRRGAAMRSVERIREEMASDKPPKYWPLTFQTPETKVHIAGFGHTREEGIAEARNAVAQLYKVLEEQVELVHA